MKFCPECGKKLTLGMKLCDECGSQVIYDLPPSVEWEDSSSKSPTHPATTSMVKILLAIFGFGSVILGVVLIEMAREGWGEICGIGGFILIILGMIFITLLVWYSFTMKD